MHKCFTLVVIYTVVFVYKCNDYLVTHENCSKMTIKISNGTFTDQECGPGSVVIVVIIILRSSPHSIGIINFWRLIFLLPTPLIIMGYLLHLYIKTIVQLTTRVLWRQALDFQTSSPIFTKIKSAFQLRNILQCCMKHVEIG